MRQRSPWEMVAIRLAASIRVAAPDIAARIATQMENLPEGVPYTTQMRMEMATAAALLRGPATETTGDTEKEGQDE